MNPDILLVIGLVVCVFAVPAIVSSLSDRRAPRTAAIAILIGGGLVVWALMEKPGGYTLAEIPDVIARVVAKVLN